MIPTVDSQELSHSGEYLAILDAGSQFGKVIDRKIRELGVETKIFPLNTPTITLQRDPALKAIVISGGPASIHDATAPPHNDDLFSNVGKPVLGICYGMQLMANVFKGNVEGQLVREDGQYEITVDNSCPLFEGMDHKMKVLLTHGDSVVKEGEHLRVVAKSSAGIITAIQHKELPLFGVQFHPEVDLTVGGKEIFRNFLKISQFSFNFTVANREEVAIQMIRERVLNDKRVLCLVSGGVDSTVCATLLNKALGSERIVCIHVDHGFMRKDESAAVVKALTAAGVKVKLVEAAEIFANAETMIPAKKGKAAYQSKKLCVTTDPEEKRQIIGDTFMHICNIEIQKLNIPVEDLLLAQGTLRPDLIESGSAYASINADAIKTHHNDTLIVRQLRDIGRIIEPLCDLHKDEVRLLGKSLGIPEALVQRHPFPGPGLAIRLLCTEGKPFNDEHYDSTRSVVASILKDSEGSFKFSPTLRSAVDAMDLAFCVLPIKTVGVQGDARTYAYAIALSMSRFPSDDEWSHLFELVKVIVKVAHYANRVVFMFGSKCDKDPKDMTPTYLVKPTIDRLRDADSIITNVLFEHGLVAKLSQMPVILLPLGFGKKNGHSVVIRTFVTNDFMTGVPTEIGEKKGGLPASALREMVSKVEQKLEWVGRVFFDMTPKPPGTTEWE